MKRIFVCMMIGSLSLTFLPAHSKAATVAVAAAGAATESAAANALIARLNVIKSMDRTAMTGLEKQSVRKEVRSIKKQLSAIGGGVYISAGALILILILLIIFL